MADATVLWEACAAAIQEKVSDVIWQMTFSAAEPVSADEETLTISVPSVVTLDRIEGRYHDMVHQAISEVSDDQLILNIVVRQDPDPVDDVISITAAHAMPAPVGTTPPTTGPSSNTLPIDPTDHSPGSGPKSVPASDIPLAGRLTFDDFVIGQSNRFAHAASLAVAETPGRVYNPLFIYGDAGLGKTHLLQAVGNYVNNHYPTQQVRYVSSETFMNRFVEAIKNKQLHEFKDRYRRNDLLLVDDIQFMEGKEGLQEEFFHTFNSIQEDGGQIVLTSDRSPDSIPTLEDRLRSRFKMGLVTHIQPPDVETRLAILRMKVERAKPTAPVPDEVLLFIAENLSLIHI